MRLLTFILASFWFLGGCRLARAGGDTPEAGGIQPASSVGGNSGGQQSKPTGSGGVILIVSFDDDGNLEERLGLRLDFFPPPRPDGVTIASCRTDINASTVLGRVTCDSEKSLAVDVTASHARQQCYTSSPAKVIEPNQVLKLAGCKGKATLKIIQRSPELKVEILN
ncbi:MAG: hypothetical protein WCL28_01415 [bacterium]